MGQRANIVIVRGGNWSLYYDHWCANLLDVELFWGPEAATAFAKKRAPLGDRLDWLDECWGEGGAVIDHDTRTLLWFGGEDITYNVDLQRAHMALLRKQWPGWQVKWALGHMAELGAHVGLPPEKFIVDQKVDESDRFFLMNDKPEDTNTLVTILQGGKTTVTGAYGYPESIAYGLVQLPWLLELPPYPSFECKSEELRSGLHIDMDAKRLYFWSVTPFVAFEQRVRQGWPGWQCEWLGDRYEDHLRIAGVDIRLPHRDLAELQRACIAHVRRYCNHEAENPARELASRILNAAISVWTDETRGSVGSARGKLAILKKLERELPVAR